MRAARELASALTMLLPALVIAREAWWHWPHPLLTGLLVSAVAHLPCSLAFHLRSAALSVRRECRDLRRLDQTMLHVSGTLFAWVLSRGSWLYALGHLGLTLHCVPRIWRRRQRWPAVACSVFLWLLPMAALSMRHFVVALLLFYVGGTGVVLNWSWVGGWGHALFHVAVAGTAKVMCSFCTITFADQ